MLTLKTARITVTAVAATFVVLSGLSAAGAATTDPAGFAGLHQLAAAQQFKASPQEPGPIRPNAPKRLSVKPGTAANSSYGCHDYVSQTSYEGPCDEHETSGGCESEATQTSYVGNCENKSEP